MAPAKTNTHRVSLDTCAQIKQLFGSPAHAYTMLRFKGAEVTYRRFTAALNYNYVTHEETAIVEYNWDAWKRHFLADPTITYFDLPSHLAN